QCAAWARHSRLDALADGVLLLLPSELLEALDGRLPVCVLRGLSLLRCRGAVGLRKEARLRPGLLDRESLPVGLSLGLVLGRLQRVLVLLLDALRDRLARVCQVVPPRATAGRVVAEADARHGLRTGRRR